MVKKKKKVLHQNISLVDESWFPDVLRKLFFDNLSLIDTDELNGHLKMAPIRDL